MPPNINRESKYIKNITKKALPYAYDPTVPTYNNLKEWDIVALKRLTNKFDYVGVITMLTHKERKIYLLVDGVEVSIKDVRKCYPAI